MGRYTNPASFRMIDDVTGSLIPFLIVYIYTPLAFNGCLIKMISLEFRYDIWCRKTRIIELVKSEKNKFDDISYFDTMINV